MSNTKYLRCSKCGRSDTPTKTNVGTSTLMRCPDCRESETVSYASMCRECCPTGHGTHAIASKVYRITVQELNEDGTPGQVQEIIESSRANPWTTVFDFVDQYRKEQAERENVEPVVIFKQSQHVEGEQALPSTIRLANASGMTVRVTVEDERYTRTILVAGCVIEQDAVDAVTPYLNTNYLIRVQTEVL